MDDEIAGEIPCSSLAVDSILRVGTAGALWGLCTGPYDSNKLGLNGFSRASFVAKSTGGYGFQCGLFAAVFSITRCGVQRYRRQNDWMDNSMLKVAALRGLGESDIRNSVPISTEIVSKVQIRGQRPISQLRLARPLLIEIQVNALIAGAVAGAAVGAGSRNWKKFAGMVGVLSASCAVVGDYRSN